MEIDAKISIPSPKFRNSRTFGEPSGHVFLGKELTRERNYSEETATVIDEEVKRLVDEAHEYALNMIREKREVLDRVAEGLVERETLDDHEFQLLVEGKPLPPEKSYSPPSPPREPQKAAKPERAKQTPPLGRPEAQPS